MKQEYINKIREACIRANSGIAICTNRSCNGIPCRNVEHYRPIQLADVLLLLNFTIKYHQSEGKLIFTKKDIYFDDQLLCKWNLTKPLEDQEEETLKFISEIVC